MLNTLKFEREAEWTTPQRLVPRERVERSLCLVRGQDDYPLPIGANLVARRRFELLSPGREPGILPIDERAISLRIGAPWTSRTPILEVEALRSVH